jgi:hypothetical protein
MIEKNDQLIDIYDIWYESFLQNRWISEVGKFCIFLLACILLYYIYKKYRLKPICFDSSIIAYRDLDVLKNFHIETKQDSKDAYFSLSLIIKKYLGSRYNNIFTRLTDKEIIKHAHLYMPDDCVRMLQKILQSMTFFKFENQIAASEKLEKDIVLIKEFISQTTVLCNKKEN